MKAIVCEMCNSNNVVKEDGFFVCQSCGTKYSVEEAKKLMVEIEGAVKIDKTDYVAKSLQNARRAKQKEDWEETEKYYNRVEEEDPGNIEAIFYSSYGKAKLSLIDSDIFKRKDAFNVLTNCISIIDDNFNEEDAAAQLEIIKDIAQDVKKMEMSSFVYKTQNSGEDAITTEMLFVTFGAEFAETLVNISRKDKANKELYLDLAADHLNFLYECFYNKLNNRQLLNKLDFLAKTIDYKDLELACWKICIRCAGSFEEKMKYQKYCHSLDPVNFKSPDAIVEESKKATVQAKKESQKAYAKDRIALIVTSIIVIIIIAWLMSR